MGPILGFRERALGWRVVKVVEKKPGKPAELESAKGMIKSDLYELRQQALLDKVRADLLQKLPHQTFVDRLAAFDPRNVREGLPCRPVEGSRLAETPTRKEWPPTGPDAAVAVCQAGREKGHLAGHSRRQVIHKTFFHLLVTRPTSTSRGGMAQHLLDTTRMVCAHCHLGEVNVLASQSNWEWPKAVQDIFQPAGVNSLWPVAWMSSSTCSATNASTPRSSMRTRTWAGCQPSESSAWITLACRACS